MPSKKFWRLTWYDFGLWCLRIQELDQVKLHDRELHLGIARSLMTMYANSHLKKGASPYSPEDFYVLSTDEQDIQEERVKIDDNLFEATMKERFKPKGR